MEPAQIIRATERQIILRYLNGFNLIGGALLLISLIGMIRGNASLAEPGQPANPYAWLLYLAAAVIMLVNGALSVSLHTRRLAEQGANKEAVEAEAAKRAAERQAKIEENP